MIRLDAVGDFFIWMQSGAQDISEFARAGGRRALLVANGSWADYAGRTGLWDEVIPVDPLRMMRHPIYRLGVLLQVRRAGAELLIQPRAGRVFLQEDAIARTCGAPMRIGNSGTLINISPRLRRIGNGFYSRVVDVDEERGTHELVRNRQFVRALTGREAGRFAFKSAATEPRITIALGAGEVGRVWPVERLAVLVEHLIRSYPSLRVQLLGLAGEMEAARKLEALAQDRMENRVGKTSLREFVAAVASARLIVCNDSSAFHIAMALDKPVVCFLGGGQYGWFAPYPKSPRSEGKAIVLSKPMECFWCNWKCKYPRASGGSLRCVAEISVAAAVRAVDSLLTEGSRAGGTAA